MDKIFFLDIFNKILKYGEKEIRIIFDSNGERLYASFVRVKWSCINDKGLRGFVENDETIIESCLEQYKTKMFLSNGTVKNATRNNSLQTSMVSIFSSRKINNYTFRLN